MFQVVEITDHLACAGHKDQTRKFSGKPYILHPRRVRELIAEHYEDPDAEAAALGHDLIEDTLISKQTILNLCGNKTFGLILEVSKISTPDDGIRVERTKIDFTHYAEASPLGQSIKVADRIDNITVANIDESVVRHNPEFADTYLRETWGLFHLLTQAKRELLDLAWVEFDLAVRELESITGRRFSPA